MPGSTFSTLVHLSFIAKSCLRFVVRAGLESGFRNALTRVEDYYRLSWGHSRADVNHLNRCKYPKTLLIDRAPGTLHYVDCKNILTGATGPEE